MNSQNPERPLISLDDLRIASPCNEPWEGMSGDARKRFCERCELQVYNLSGMTRDEATDLVSEAEGRLCVRFHRRSDGTVLTQDCPVGLAARTGRFIKACAAGLLALVAFLPGCKEKAAEAPAQRGGDAIETPAGDDVGTDAGSIEPGETIEGLDEVLQGDLEIIEREPLMGVVLPEPEPELGKGIHRPIEKK